MEDDAGLDIVGKTWLRTCDNSKQGRTYVTDERGTYTLMLPVDRLSPTHAMRLMMQCRLCVSVGSDVLRSGVWLLFGVGSHEYLALLLPTVRHEVRGFLFL